jgi:riboflavin synthase
VHAVESVAVSGICLTVTKVEDHALHFDVASRNIRTNDLGQKKADQFINMERSLARGQEMGGHIVVGHVDGTAVVNLFGRWARLGL